MSNNKISSGSGPFCSNEVFCCWVVSLNLSWILIENQKRCSGPVPPSLWLGGPLGSMLSNCQTRVADRQGETREMLTGSKNPRWLSCKRGRAVPSVRIAGATPADCARTRAPDSKHWRRDVISCCGAAARPLGRLSGQPGESMAKSKNKWLTGTHSSPHFKYQTHGDTTGFFFSSQRAER